MTDATEEIELQRRLLGKRKLRYSLDFAQYYHRWYNALILGMLAPAPDLTALDCGCGTGVLLPQLEPCYRRVVGLDLSAVHLLEARALARRASLVAGDIARLPLAAQSFDHVVCRGVLHRLPDVRAAFRGLFDILRQGGDLVISEPIADSRLIRLFKSLVNCIPARSYKSKELAYKTKDWIQMAQAAGFQIETWFNFGYLALPLLGFPDQSRVIRWIPLRMPLARLLVRLDSIIADIPWIKRQSLQAVFHFRKP
jgi:SAM-dependent methyltransferase